MRDRDKRVNRALRSCYDGLVALHRRKYGYARDADIKKLIKPRDVLRKTLKDWDKLQKRQYE